MKKNLRTIGRANCAKISKILKLYIALGAKTHKLIIYILLAINFCKSKAVMFCKGEMITY